MYVYLTRSALPQTRHIRGSNHCYINIVADRVPGSKMVYIVDTLYIIDVIHDKL